MTEHAFLDDLSVYALGALAVEDRARLEAHLATRCAECARELPALEATAARLAWAAPPRAVPAEAKERILASVLADGSGRPRPVPLPGGIPPSARPERRAAVWLPLAASLLLAAGAVGIWLATRGKVESLSAELAASRQEAGKLRTRLAAEVAETAWLRDPRVQVALMKGLAGAEGASAKLLWNPGTKRGILYVAGLPPLPLEKSYELWAFVGDTPRPAGVFDATEGGATVVSLDTLAAAAERPTKFAVSIEPKGGVPAPTGTVVLFGETF